MDKIHIRDLLLRCIIGIEPEEREKKQDVVISITIHADLAEAGRSDNFALTVDYKSVKKRVVELVEGSEFHLIESLAESVAAVCLEPELVERVDVLVEKPGALRFARTVGVEISRSKNR